MGRWDCPLSRVSVNRKIDCIKV